MQSILCLCSLTTKSFSSPFASQSYNFDIATGISNFSVPYDYCSIMHYGMKSFGMGRQITMLTKDPDHQLSIGNRGVPTFSDFKVVNIMYKCNAHCPSDPSCNGECYVNHKCQCKCPSANDCPKRACGDIYPTDKCEKYVRDQLCGDGRNCAKSCGVCDQVNKSNGVRTIDAIFLEFVPFYRTSTCSFELLPLKSSSDSHTFLFHTLVYRNFGQKRRFCAISTRV